VQTLQSLVQRQSKVIAECFLSFDECASASVTVEALFALLILSEFSRECFAVMTGHFKLAFRWRLAQNAVADFGCELIASVVNRGLIGYSR